MDDLIVVKRALSADEVLAYVNRAPAVNLHLDEGLQTDRTANQVARITTFADDSDNGYAATCSAADTCPDAGDKGQIREAVTFDGNDVLTLAGASSLPLTNFNVGMWVKPTKTVNAAQYLWR